MKINKTLSSLVIALAVVALIATGGAQLSARAVPSSAPQLEGSWEITVIPDGADPIVDLCTFTTGGGLTNSDPDPNLSTGHGTWVKTGDDEFTVTFIHFLSDQGTQLGTLKVRAVIQLDKHTDTLSGPFRTDVIIGGDVVQSFCGTVQGKRIAVEPLDACP